MTYIKRARSAKMFLLILLTLTLLTTGCNKQNNSINKSLDFCKYYIQINNIKNWIIYKNPNLTKERAINLAKYYIDSSKKYNINVSYILSIGFIESRYEPNQRYIGNYGIQQINWSSHKKRINKIYNIDDKFILMKDDKTNIDYSSLLVKEMCTDRYGQNCNLDVLVRKYNGRKNIKYRNKLKYLINEYNNKYK